MDDDVDEARMQLRQALAHCAQDREELDRLRKMLQQERETAQRREREIEELQASNAAEIAKLNETLRRAEQVSSCGGLHDVLFWRLHACCVEHSSGSWG
jgi:dsDNA-specific endonuclease/ATPase MutS2